VLPSLARLGIGQLFPVSFWSGLPGPAAGQVAAFSSSPRGWRNVRDESAAMPALSTNSSHRNAHARTHVGLLGEGRGADVSAQAIADVIQAARTGSPLPPH
jgi:hypothetical protein